MYWLNSKGDKWEEKSSAFEKCTNQLIHLAGLSLHMELLEKVEN